MQSLRPYQKQIESLLEGYLDQLPKTPKNLQKAIRYASLNQGKRIRPAMVFAIGEAFGIDPKHLAAPACALELIHCYSLVHDDLPAMDDDQLRRGQPTCHIAFNEATAILVGDALQTLCFEILASATEISSQHRLQMIQLISQAAGPSGMVAGQQIDMNSENATTPLYLTQLEQLHQLKTGALLKTALLLGACQSSVFEKYKPALETLGEKIGLAFQVHDDILDIESDSATLGKTAGKDERAKKSTYPQLLGLSQAKTYRDQLIQEAKHLLKNLPNPHPKNQSDFLTELVDFIASRTH